jgi:hypothetical protein
MAVKTMQRALDDATAPAKVEKVFYWRARCDKCPWSGGDMLFHSEAEQEAKSHNDYAHGSREGNRSNE